MFKLAICDDDSNFTKSFCKVIDRLKPYEGNYVIDIYNSGKELLSNISKNYFIIFLDIDLNESENGTEIAVRIKEYNSKVLIVFFTGFFTPPLEAFKSTPLRYLIKPINEDILKELEAIFNESLKHIEFIIIKSGTQIYKVKIESILYITIYYRNIKVFTDDKTYISNEKIDNMYKKLSSFGFAFSHKSYLVNMNRIYMLEKDNIKIDNGDIIPISQPKSSNFKKNFSRYSGEKGWNQ